MFFGRQVARSSTSKNHPEPRKAVPRSSRIYCDERTGGPPFKYPQRRVPHPGDFFSPQGMGGHDPRPPVSSSQKLADKGLLRRRNDIVDIVDISFPTPQAVLCPKSASKTRLFALISRQNGLKSCCFALFVTRLPVLICVHWRVSFNIAACAYHATFAVRTRGAWLAARGESRVLKGHDFSRAVSRSK